MELAPSFARHHFIKQRSAAFSQHLKAVASPSNIVLQIDFAENFTCKFQDEIQSAHWKQKQVTVFTACLWNGSEKPLSYVVVSDNHEKHDKYAVVAYIVQVLRCYQLDSGAIIELNVVSDGPSSQMKNRYIFSILVSDLKCNLFERSLSIILLICFVFCLIIRIACVPSSNCKTFRGHFQLRVTERVRSTESEVPQNGLFGSPCSQGKQCQCSARKTLSVFFASLGPQSMSFFLALWRKLML